MNVRHGFENYAFPWIFILLLALGLGLGFYLRASLQKIGQDGQSHRKSLPWASSSTAPMENRKSIDKTRFPKEWYADPSDVNNDGKVDVADAVSVLKTLCGLDAFHADIAEKDVDHDGEIGLEEGILVLRKAAGL